MVAAAALAMPEVLRAQQALVPFPPAFDIGVGVGKLGLRCIEPCPMQTFAAGPVLAVGVPIGRRWYLGGQIVGAAGERDDGAMVWAWSIMPHVKYRPHRLLYLSVGAGPGELGTDHDGRDVTTFLWSSEVRVGYTIPKRPVLTPFVSMLTPLKAATAKRDGVSVGIRRPGYLLIGLSMSYPGFLDRAGDGRQPPPAVP